MCDGMWFAREEAAGGSHGESVVVPHHSWHFEGDCNKTMETRGDLFYVWAVIVKIWREGLRCKLQPTYGMRLEREEVEIEVELEIGEVEVFVAGVGVRCCRGCRVLA